MFQTNYHTSVLHSEVLEALNILPGETYLDCTLGGGGHTQGILNFTGKVVALDVDEDAIRENRKKFDLLESNGVWVTKDGNLKIIKTNFQNLDEALERVGEKSVAGVLFDLGVSSFMLETPERGFSFSKPGPLDMRMDQSLSVTAEHLVNGLNEGELYELFTRLGEVSDARRLARAICRSRVEKKIETTQQLAKIVNPLGKRKKGEIDPATKVFMALRIVVNDELNSLKEALPKAAAHLKPGGRLVVLSFHSLEDRIVKDFFKSSRDLTTVTEKPITPSEAELKKNRRSRSVKMRVAEKTEIGNQRTEIRNKN